MYLYDLEKGCICSEKYHLSSSICHGSLSKVICRASCGANKCVAVYTVQYTLELPGAPGDSPYSRSGVPGNTSVFMVSSGVNKKN